MRTQLPPAEKVRDALRTIETANQAITELMADAGIPRPGCLVTEGIVRSMVAVHLRSSERIFESDGKINCQNGYASYDQIKEAIERASNNLQLKKAKRRG